MKRIYLDHAAATPIRPEVKQAMVDYGANQFGNASSLHEEGRMAREALESARKTIAKAINASADELIFTGSGTESCNLAVFGSCFGDARKGRHVVITAVEHHAVLRACEMLTADGFEVTIVPVDRYGKADPLAIKEAVREDTVFVSVILANNEVGTINDVKQISRFVKERNPKTIVHTDACQAPGLLKIDVKSLGVDLLSINASKIYGPKGVAALYVKRGVMLHPIAFGGGQERGLRSGTENVDAIVGFARAMELAEREREATMERLLALRQRLEKGVAERISGVRVNSHPTDRIANNLNMSISGVEGEALVIYLDEADIAVSTGSACTTSETGPSHVIKAIGNTESDNLRITLGRFTTKKELDYFLKILLGAVKKIRKIYL